MKPAVLHCGMGFDSCCWLIDYLTNPSSRQFELAAVVMSQTGSESVLVKEQMERHIYPLLAQHQVRTVQIARASSTLRDGYTVLDSSRSPTTCHIRPTTAKPYWSLGDEMLISATVPQFSKGKRHCSDKFKIEILEKWHDQHCPGCQKIIGFNADEGSRVAKAYSIHSNHEHSFPLYEQGWNRSRIERMVLDYTGEFYLSACTMCSFSQICGGGEAVKERWQLQPYEGARAAYLEYVALCFNPKQTLATGGKSIIQRRLLSHEALELFELELSEAEWKVYEVRRMRGQAVPYRSIKPLIAGNRASCESYLALQASYYNEPLTYCQHDIPRLHLPVLGDGCEKFLVAAPGDPQAKERTSFQSIWDKRNSPYQQLELFK